MGTNLYKILNLYSKTIELRIKLKQFEQVAEDLEQYGIGQVGVHY